MSESFVYITCSKPVQADMIGEAIVEKRLAACVNIIENMRSIYWWKGNMEKGHEVVMIAKTRTSLVGELTDAVKAMHEYDVPCIVSVPIKGGNPDFLNWIREETGNNNFK